MSTSNCPNPLSADAVLKSLERVATVIGYGQSLDSIFSLALKEIQRLLHSDRILLGKRMVNDPELPLSSTTLALDHSIEYQSVSARNSYYPNSCWSRADSHPTTQRTTTNPFHVSIQIFHESLGPSIASSLHQILVLEYKWLKCSHIWNEAATIVPIWIHGELWGMLINQPDQGKGLEPDLKTYHFIDRTRGVEGELQLLQGMATQLAIAIQQSQLRQTLELQAHHSGHLTQLKDEFLSTISHELRTPLSSIKMATEMMDRTLQHATDPVEMHHKLRKYVQILQNETEREIQLINNLLDLSRLEANAEPILLNTVDLKRWLSNLINLATANITQAGLQLRLTMDPHLSLLRTDLSHLSGILEELLHNATKYTPPGEEISMTVTPSLPQTPLHAVVMQAQHAPASYQPSLPYISALPRQSLSRTTSTTPLLGIAHTDSERPIVSITVHNSGIMIPATEYDRIFDKFYRIPSNDPWQHSGTGLGLALLKCRVDAIRGVVRVSSDQIGTAFTVMVPNLMYRPERDDDDSVSSRL